MDKVVFITGATRGIGAAVARAALAEGNRVVATGRRPEAFGENVLAVPLDVTKPQDARAAAEQAVEHFGRIDVLVNNAGAFHPGYFEELSAADMRQQIETNLFGPMN